MHQSISALAPPHLPTVFPWTEGEWDRSLGQKSGQVFLPVSQPWHESFQPDAMCHRQIYPNECDHLLFKKPIIFNKNEYTTEIVLKEA